jgi:peptide chain release factor 3
VETTLESLPFQCSAWLDGDPETFKLPYTSIVVKDRLDRAMVLFPNALAKTYAQERNPDHALLALG